MQPKALDYRTQNPESERFREMGPDSDVTSAMRTGCRCRPKAKPNQLRIVDFGLRIDGGVEWAFQPAKDQEGEKKMDKE
ncbi:MAG: hypothetical protein JW941_03305 [Candidatus Coatesbacteria bacterium]|nr:hypothetical protein [Candidatus Coatesbacteria bacterium]